MGLERDLVAATAADTGAQTLRTAAVVLHNAPRVDEACATDIADLGEDCGYRVLRWSARGEDPAHSGCTTRRYDHSRDSLDRNAAYTVAATWREPESAVPRSQAR